MSLVFFVCLLIFIVCVAGIKQLDDACREQSGSHDGALGLGLLFIGAAFLAALGAAVSGVLWLL
jgi:hypothetical protein